MKINKILSLTNHCLHLCNDSNIEEIVFSYLMDTDAFVTNNVEVWKKRFDENGIKCQIRKPDEVKQNVGVVVDGSSLSSNFEKWENRWKKQKKAICIYNIDKIEPSILKDLVSVHDKMLLSVDKVRVFSDKNFEKKIEDINPEVVEKLVKRELKNIVLSLLLLKPMAGTDLVKVLYTKFKVFISPGMLYPTLHELEKKGLLKYECKLKRKVYAVQEKEQAELLLKRQAEANSLLSQFLLSE